MANARTRFDTIRDYMTRSHEASSGMVYGKPCSMFRGRAFIAFHLDGMGFKLRGRMRLQALALSDTRFWDPLMPDRPDPEWVWVPQQHFLRWDRLAVEAYRQQKEQGDAATARNVRNSPASAPLVPRAPTAAASGGSSLSLIPEAAEPERAERSGSTPMPAASGQLTARPLPNWAERLKKLTSWAGWTTSKPGEKA